MKALLIFMCLLVLGNYFSMLYWFHFGKLRMKGPK